MWNLRTWLIANIACAGMLYIAPANQARADAEDYWERRAEALEDYWDNYWKWYDNDYRRYYTRRYYIPYQYRSYYYPGTPNYQPGPYGYGTYLRHPHRYPYGYYNSEDRSRGSIGVGPFRLEWR